MTTKRLVSGIGLVIVAVIMGTTAVRAQDRCTGAGGGNGSETGCSEEGVAPTEDAECSQGNGDCYECEVQCPAGTVHCAEMDDGYPYQCCWANHGCWGWEAETPPGDEEYQQTEPGSPILIDLDGNGFHLAGLDEAVLFDLPGNGVFRYYSWTSAGGGDGFLCRDRDGSGGIENGRELFGDATMLADGSRAHHGYEALRDLDTSSQGGNGDGRLTAEDSRYRELCIWVDVDHDGRSDAGEVLSLAQAGVLEISYEFHDSRRRDVHGNEFRYKSQAVVANPSGRPRYLPTWDVFFLSRPAY